METSLFYGEFFKSLIYLINHHASICFVYFYFVYFILTFNFFYNKISIKIAVTILYIFISISISIYKFIFIIIQYTNFYVNLLVKIIYNDNQWLNFFFLQKIFKFLYLNVFL